MGYDIFSSGDAEDENDCISVDIELREAGWSRLRGKEAELFNKKEPEDTKRGYCPSNLSKRRWYGPILTPDEERDLLRKAQAGDGGAKEELLRRFHRMLIKTADEYFGPSFDDRMAAAVLGFMEAIAAFDLRSNSRTNGLSAFARAHIKKRVFGAVEDWAKGGNSSDTRAEREAGIVPTETVPYSEGAVDDGVAGDGGYHRLEKAVDPEASYSAKNGASEWSRESGRSGREPYLTSGAHKDGPYVSYRYRWRGEDSDRNVASWPKGYRWGNKDGKRIISQERRRLRLLLE